jgi:hypothetical protein
LSEQTIHEELISIQFREIKIVIRKEIEKTYSTQDIFEFNLIYCDAMVNKLMAKIKNPEGMTLLQMRLLLRLFN